MKFLKVLLLTVAAAFTATLAHAIPISMVKTTTRGPVITITDMKLGMSNAQLTHDVEFYNWVSGPDYPTITAPWASWTGYVATPNDAPPAGALEHVIQFEFRSEGYFVANNIGHFIVGLRSKIDQTGLASNGIIIGNVSGYTNGTVPSETCNRATSPNAMSLAVFWDGNNCVMGSSTTSVTLKDNTDYFVIFMAGESKQKQTSLIDGYLRYVLMEKVSGNWVVVDSANFDIPVTNFSPTNFKIMPHGGWFMAEDLSNHYWQFKVKNLKAYWVVQ